MGRATDLRCLPRAPKILLRCDGARIDAEPAGPFRPSADDLDELRPELKSPATA